MIQYILFNAIIWKDRNVTSSLKVLCVEFTINKTEKLVTQAGESRCIKTPQLNLLPLDTLQKQNLFNYFEVVHLPFILHKTVNKCV